MTKVLLSVVGIMGLTLATWAVEGHVAPTSQSLMNDNLLIHASGVKRECQLHDHKNGEAIDSSTHKNEKGIAGAKKHRDPVAAERLGLMLRLTSL